MGSCASCRSTVYQMTTKSVASSRSGREFDTVSRRLYQTTTKSGASSRSGRESDAASRRKGPLTMRTVKIRKNDDVAKTMATFVAMFNSIEDAQAFEKG